MTRLVWTLPDGQQTARWAEDDGAGDSTSGFEVINVRDYGAVGDLDHDDDAAFQAAFDAAQASIPEDGVAGTPVYIPPGEYLIGSTITWKDHEIIGAGPNQARLYWGGAAGDGTLLMDHRNYGGVRMTGVQFRAGAGLNTVGSWLHMSIADNKDVLSHVQFSEASLCQVEVNTVVNLHWDHMRWATMMGPGLLLNMGDNNARNVTIDDFTIGDGNASFPSQGFIKCLFTGAGQIGIALRNGRLEGDANLWDDDSYLVGLFGADAGLGAIKLTLENLDCEFDAPQPASFAVFRKDAACDDTIIPYINVHRCGFTGINEFMTGTYTLAGNTWTPPSLPSGKMVENWAVGRSGAGGFENTFEQLRIGLLGVDISCFTSYSAVVADGGTLTHGMTRTPLSIHVTPSVAGEMVSVTSLSTLTATLAIKKHDGTAGTEQTVYYTVVCS